METFLETLENGAENSKTLYCVHRFIYIIGSLLILLFLATYVFKNAFEIAVLYPNITLLQY